MKGIYLHIPFCRKKCGYCDFPSTDRWEEALLKAYIDAILRDMEASLPPWKDYTLYVGGGTPSILPPNLLERLLSALKELLHHPLEFTFEANPESLTREKLELMVQAGVTRLSLGVQSFNDRLLTVLGRIHTGKEALRKAAMAREYMDNLNLDLIFGIPGQGLQDLEKDLETALALEPAHVSAYSLTLEGTTPLVHQAAQGNLTMPPEEEWLQMFHLIPEILSSGGLVRYEISNFARPGRECLHNLIYWENGEYLGVGASAVSHLGGKRLFRGKDPRTYIQKISQGISPVVEKEDLPPRRKVLETAMVGLRTTQGVDPAAIEEKWGAEGGKLKAILEDLETQGLLERNRNRWRIPERLLPVANEVMVKVLEFKKPCIPVSKEVRQNAHRSIGKNYRRVH